MGNFSVLCVCKFYVPKEFNLKRLYFSLHGEKFNKYDRDSRVALVNDFKKKLKQQTEMFTEVVKVQTCSLSASYTVALERPSQRGHLVMEVR
jgi:hypothetical protein